MYFFEHHRFDCVALGIVDQRDGQLHLNADVEGDIDGLGLGRVSVAAWLDFDGVASPAHGEHHVPIPSGA